MRKKSRDQVSSSINPWFIILLTAPVPIVLLIFFLIKWYQEKTDFRRLTSHFLERQNTVLAHNALAVSKEISSLLEHMVHDVQVLPFLAREAAVYSRFHSLHHGLVSAQGAGQEEIPFYSEIAVLDSAGDEKLALVYGRTRQPLRKFSQCTESVLCDRTLIEKVLRLKTGSLEVGRLMRWYSPKGVVEDFEEATLRVALRAERAVYVLGLDYRHLKELLHVPSFPYERKSDLLDAYEKGNYIYFMDHRYDFLAHPKYWHVVGIDKASLKRLPPIRLDGEDGTRPLNIAAYQGEKLREYFNRLLRVSFTQKGVDIFRAPNLRGITRVLSVAPILFDRGQFKETGVFGYVVMGCNVDYFEEPKEKVIPYY